jgi:hypothetical protein
MKFQDYSSNGSRDTNEKFIFQLSTLQYRRIVNKLTAFAAHAWNVRSVKLQDNPSFGSRDRGENVLCSPCKLSFIIDRSHPNLHPEQEKVKQSLHRPGYTLRFPGS